MGEANRRGTPEQRRQMAIIRRRYEALERIRYDVIHENYRKPVVLSKVDHGINAFMSAALSSNTVMLYDLYREDNNGLSMRR